MSNLDSVEIEVSVLSSIFARPANLWLAAEIINPGHFRDIRNRFTFDAMMKLAMAGEPFDYSAVRQSLKESQHNERVKEAHLSSLDDTFADVTNVAYFAQKVSEEFVRYEAIKTANVLRADLRAGQNVKKALEIHQEAMLKLHGTTDAGGAVHISGPVADAMERLEKLKNGDISGFGVETGIGLLDEKYSFLSPKNVYVVCGGVSAGKSALVDQIADVVAKQGKNVYITCLEMSAIQRAERFVSRRAKVSLMAWQAKEFISRDAEKRLKEAASDFAEPPIYIDDARGITTMDIMARAKRFKDTHGLGLLVLDYLQLIKPIRRAPREQEVAEISGAVNEMAGTLDIPVILVSQLSRTHQIEGREPELRDLRESGRIEQDAFGVIAVYRPDIEDPRSKLLVLKNRQGPLGRREVRFVGEQVRFEEYTGEEEDGY